MKSRIGLVALLLLSLVVSAHAANPGSQARAILVVPPVEYSRDGVMYRPLYQGMVVSPGTTVKTGKGMLTLRFWDGSEIGLKNDSVLTITKSQHTAEVSHTWLNLAKGFARALVHKLSQGSDFQVQTSNAVAAVKGTDYETGFENGETTVKVFSTDGLGVELSDLNKETSTLVQENEAGAMNTDGTLETPHTMTEEEKKASLEGYSQLNLTNPNGGSTTGSPEATAATTAAPTAGATAAATAAPTAVPAATAGTTGSSPEPTAAPTAETSGNNTEPTAEATVETSQAAGEDLAAQVADAVSDLQGSEQVANQTEQAAQTTDAFLGNNLVDRHGYRVQVSRYILRPDNRTVSKVSITSRSEGPQSGTSRFENAFTYNKDLPFDWTVVANRSLNDPANVDVTGPNYYLVKAGITATNASNNEICNCRTYDTPTALGGGLYGQPSHTYYNVDHHNVGYQDFNANGVWLGKNVGGDDIQVVTGATADGGWKAEFFEQNNPVTPHLLFSETIYLLNGDGVQQSLGDYLSNPAQLRDFSLISRSVAINLTFQAPSWGGNSVDLLLLPDFLTSDF